MIKKIIASIYLLLCFSVNKVCSFNIKVADTTLTNEQVVSIILSKKYSIYKKNKYLPPNIYSYLKDIGVEKFFLAERSDSYNSSIIIGPKSNPRRRLNYILRTDSLLILSYLHGSSRGEHNHLLIFKNSDQSSIMNLCNKVYITKTSKSKSLKQMIKEIKKGKANFNEGIEW